MKRVALLGLLLLAACNKTSAPAPEAAKGGPPPLPPYQMRAEAPTGDRLAAGGDGAKLYSVHCGYCHLPAGMGTNLLTKQRMMMGEPPENGLLTNRKDLTADYIKSAVRMGKVAMPRQTRVDITDAELDAVAAYLAKADK
jgi:mono/diheme cytochrome c family protein